jgi:spore coat polysaccharide biosynthesis predicted glycosyltransferase SpsG
MTTVIQLAEADNKVGFGHLRELHAIGASFEKKGISVQTYVIGTAPAGMQWTTKARWVDNSEGLSRLIWNSDAGIGIWSFRRRLDTHLEKLFDHLGSVRVWITDQPAESVHAQVVVIPTILGHLNGNWPGRVLQGLEYLPVEASLASDPPQPEARPHDVLMSLGGADPSRATLRLLPELTGFDSTVVIGPGFVHADEVRHMAGELGIRHIKAPDGLQSLLHSHRVVVSAGGNTLAEAAAAGAPALVTWEDPHERHQGEVFETRGAALVVGQGAAVEPNILNQQIRKLLDSPARLRTMALAGRKAVDGLGATRIVEAILEEVK